jgi:translation initiation factor 2B subunit (eIF-2B alpha/beta/delta family)
MIRDSAPPTAQQVLLDAPSVSLKRQLEAVQREIRMRRRKYPAMVACRRITAKKAQDEIAAMEAVEQTLISLIERPDR